MSDVAGRTACMVGAGVIGAGWAARFLLNGWQVRVVEPDATNRERLGRVLERARRAAASLSDSAPLPEGSLQFDDSLADAAGQAVWVQESVSENLDLKHKVLQDVLAHSPPGAVIASSTSGFTPSELNGFDGADGRVIVAHPFNPVYLLPLVELVTVPDAGTAALEQPAEVLTSLGMKPLIVRREIAAHIADRLLEAMWREALWLVHDDIASTTEIDDAVRYGFGLRWAQMGMFETYRLAGGEAGMAHFMRQFGPALQWPWTKLTDVPELTEELVQKIADQSDAQSGKYSIDELEDIRDRNLVGILRALRETDWAAGRLLNAAEISRGMA